MTDPIWLSHARGYVGLSEIPGPKHNPIILRFWKLIRAPFKDDETPWCAGFVGGVLEEQGFKSTRSAAARSYLKWGVPLEAPAVGCIVVFSRGHRQGHVGFVVGKDQRGNLMVLGGNQADAVNVKPFSKARVLDFRWPAGEDMPESYVLPVVNSNGTLSRREAAIGLPSPEEPDEEFDTVDNASWDDEEPKQSLWKRAKRFVLGGGLGSFGIGAGWLSGIEPQTIAIVCTALLIVFLVVWFFPRRSDVPIHS